MIQRTVPDQHDAQVTLDATNPSHRVHIVGPDVAIAAMVKDGEAFLLRTQDASGDQIRPNTAPHELDPEEFFPVTGPVHVEGLLAGDGVIIRVLEVVPDPVGHMWTRPGIGIRPPGGWRVHPVDTTDLALVVNGRELARLEPAWHIGALGVLPAEPVAARDLGVWGGNLDTPLLGQGAALWLPTFVDGAGVWAGDVHASIGDAEICGTGVEAAARVVLSATKVASSPTLPTLLRPGATSLLAVGDTVEEALGVAVDEVVSRLMAYLCVDAADAYIAASATLRISVRQVVNPHVTVEVSLGSGLDHALAPGIHLNAPHI